MSSGQFRRTDERIRQKSSAVYFGFCLFCLFCFDLFCLFCFACFGLLCFLWLVCFVWWVVGVVVSLVTLSH